jgi:hypothetical protein
MHRALESVNFAADLNQTRAGRRMSGSGRRMVKHRQGRSCGGMLLPPQAPGDVGSRVNRMDGRL